MKMSGILALAAGLVACQRAGVADEEQSPCARAKTTAPCPMRTESTETREVYRHGGRQDLSPLGLAVSMDVPAGALVETRAVQGQPSIHVRYGMDAMGNVDPNISDAFQLTLKAASKNTDCDLDAHVASTWAWIESGGSAKIERNREHDHGWELTYNVTDAVPAAQSRWAVAVWREDLCLFCGSTTHRSREPVERALGVCRSLERAVAGSK
ncbi:hypothetical protein ACFL6C_00955 [Myxococcota bacterium]